MYIGEIAALSAAAVWTTATWMYGRFTHNFNALQLNIVKGIVASVMMMMVMPFLPEVSLDISPNHLAILAVSGVIGIAVGDSAYFASLKRIGASHTLLLESLAPPLSGVLALMVLGSTLDIQSWLGVVVTTVAVTLVVFQPMPGQALSLSGIGFGLLASICQASGVVISHYALVAGDLPPLLGALIRLSVGVLAVIVVVMVQEKAPWRVMLTGWFDLGRKRQFLLLIAIFLGTFLGLWLQQVALKYANPAIAQTLIATSPVVMLLIQKMQGEPISRRAVLGTLFAVGGISLFFL
ncbi:DMT family transporter [Thaumasiovibrio subtropicus]|uniref:DMT family transporter n=1 Tax=Thaumasiovibrio subtropicus TaxID=1891207 RepID=UPI000B351F75|nr:DMT family transporter [Thaumasiovibrio subtropicus]